MKEVGMFYGRWNMLRPVSVFYGHLVIYVVAIW
jgi:hypothetical protein